MTFFESLLHNYKPRHFFQSFHGKDAECVFYKTDNSENEFSYDENISIQFLLSLFFDKKYFILKHRRDFSPVLTGTVSTPYWYGVSPPYQPGHINPGISTRAYQPCSGQGLLYIKFHNFSWSRKISDILCGVTREALWKEKEKRKRLRTLKIVID